MIRSVILIAALTVPATSFAANPGPLPRTTLYTSLASGCTDVDLARWKHPTREVLIQSGARIERVQLCNDKKYPVFHVQFPFDPQGQTKDYFLPLYQKMRKANGGWPYSFVVTSDNLVVNVSYPKKDAISLDHETYKP